MPSRQRVEAQVTSLGNGRFKVSVIGEDVTLSATALGGSSVRVQVYDHQFTTEVIAESHRVTVLVVGRIFSFGLPNALSDLDEDQAGGDSIIAPMPGLVRAVHGKQGASVTKGEALLVLEAMKMEHTLVAPRDGIIAEILASEGEQVTNGTLLLALEPQDE